MRIVSGFPTFIFAVAAVCFGLSARPALAGPFDGKWIADIPAQERCNYTGTMNLVVAGDTLGGSTFNTSASGNSLVPFTGKIDVDGNATFLVSNRWPGTMKFSADHFDATWNNGACDRHAEGDRAPDEKQVAALAAGRRQHQDAYADLVRRAEAGDKAVDYTALRAESVYAENWDFYDGKANGLLQQASAAARGKDCTAALEKLDQVIRLDFTIDSAHSLRADCLKQVGNPAKARIESDIADGLIHSLMDSGSGGAHGLLHALSGEGDGATEPAAYVVSTLREEMDVLANRHIQLKYRQTEIRGSNGHYYDLIRGVSIRSGSTVDVTLKDIYFDIGGFMTGRASHRAVVETAQASIH